MYKQTHAIKIKHTIALKLQEAMEAKKITKAEMARRMRTSRSQLDRLLDPENITVQLETVLKAAFALGKYVNITFVEKGDKVA